ncbi:MAG TPA: AI-2E family transporter [Candidatus Kaiserbacteria bacterium]|nr:AI-2E family transporter [Candidatus Kaiserbacteria bacterium]
MDIHNNKHTISITPGTMVTAVVIGFIVFALWLLRDLVLLVITAIILASAVRPGILFFVRFKIPRALAVFFTYFIALAIIFGSIYFFLPPLLAEVQRFISALPNYLNSASLPLPFRSSSGLFSTGSGGASITNIVTALQSAFINTSTGALRLLTAIFGGIFSLVFVVVLSFYFAVQESGIEDFLRTVTPLSRESYVIDLWHRSQKKIGLWMQGQILLSVFVGMLVYLGLLIIGIPYALLLGVFTAIMEIIPIFGSFISAIPAIMIAFSFGGLPLALIVTGLYVVVNQFEAHLIYPLVVRKIVGVPPLLVIIAMVAGAELAGFLGILLSIPLAAILQEFVNDLDKSRRARATTK